MDLRNLNLDIFLIRHGQPLNPPNHWTSQSSSLSDQGMVEARTLAKELESQKFDKLISSPFLRTSETAEIIQKNLIRKIPLEIEEWLGEIDLGDWAGKDKREIKTDPKYPKFFLKDKAVFQEPLVARLMNTNKDFTFPGGESLETFWNRVQEGFSGLINDYRDKDHHTIGLVGHGGSFSVITSIMLAKTFSDSNFPIIGIKMAKYAHIRIFKERVVFVKVN